jgi:hypothetical protein
MIYDRDFNILTREELEKTNEAKIYLKENSDQTGGISIEVLCKYHDIRPTASYHYESLFPNNFLCTRSLDDKSYLKKIEVEFETLLNSNISEQNILNFINGNKYYNLIASIFHTGFRFGHHDAYLFKEFELPATYKADYLLIGKNSDGYHFIFIELENPSGSITTKDGSFGLTIRKGIKQVQSWDRWLEGNFHSLSLVLDKSKNSRVELPKEFRVLNKTRINYVVIAGRRADFNENTYDAKRKLLRTDNIMLLHYDNLIDSFRLFQSTNNY